MNVPVQQPVYVYEWQWRVQVSLPPPIKTGGSNNGTWAGARSFYLSTTNYAGQDCAAVFRGMKTGDTVKMEHKTDPTIWAWYSISVPPIEYPTAFTFPIIDGERYGNPADNTVYKFTFTTGAPQKTARLSIGEHLANLSVITSGMLNKENVNLSTVGDDAIQVYDRLVRSYLETPELPQPVPPPALPGDASLEAL